jgi:hypothetical protein
MPKASKSLKPLKTKIKRLWITNENGKTKFYASIRDFIVQRAIEKNRPLEVYLEGTEERMIIPVEQLKKGKVSKEVFVSKINSNQTYKLIDFEWKPVKQPNLFDPKVFSKLVL